MEVSKPYRTQRASKAVKAKSKKNKGDKRWANRQFSKFVLKNNIKTYDDLCLAVSNALENNEVGLHEMFLGRYPIISLFTFSQFGQIGKIHE